MPPNLIRYRGTCAGERITRIITIRGRRWNDNPAWRIQSNIHYEHIYLNFVHDPRTIRDTRHTACIINFVLLIFFLFSDRYNLLRFRIAFCPWRPFGSRQQRHRTELFPILFPTVGFAALVPLIENDRLFSRSTIIFNDFKTFKSAMYR